MKLVVIECLNFQILEFFDNQQNPNDRSNAFVVEREGMITAPSLDVEEITDPKSLVTKEYLDANSHANRCSEMIQYNDCFYRNMYMYKYVVPLDVDELIIPQGKLKLWSEMALQVERLLPLYPQETNALAFRNAYFFEEDKNIIPTKITY